MVFPLGMYDLNLGVFVMSDILLWLYGLHLSVQLLPSAIFSCDLNSSEEFLTLVMI